MSQNGKGSAPRQRSTAERKRFEDNYDAIFRKPMVPIPTPLYRQLKRAYRSLIRKKT